MTGKKGNAAIVGVGVAACAVCCAGPILGVLAAIGLGTTVGFASFGTLAVVIGAAAVALAFVRRRHHTIVSGCGGGGCREDVRVRG